MRAGKGNLSPKTGFRKCMSKMGPIKWDSETGEGPGNDSRIRQSDKSSPKMGWDRKRQHKMGVQNMVPEMGEQKLIHH